MGEGGRGGEVGWAEAPATMTSRTDRIRPSCNLAEAERRIEEARRSRAESRDLCLSEIPASLGDVPQLEALYLGKKSTSTQMLPMTSLSGFLSSRISLLSPASRDS